MGTAAGVNSAAQSPQQPFGGANTENLFPSPNIIPNADLNDDIFYYWMKKTGIPQFNLLLDPSDTATDSYLKSLNGVDKNLAYREKPKELLSTIQTALTRFGYSGLDGKPLKGDGIYDADTDSALSEFLDDEGIEDSENIWERVQKAAHTVFDSVLDGAKRQDEINRLQADLLYKGAKFAGEKIGDLTKQATTALGDMAEKGAKDVLGNVAQSILPFFRTVSGTSQKNIKRNYEHNQKLDEENIENGTIGPGIHINGQGRDSYANYLFGENGNVADNGCGSIAIYNALTDLGEYMPLSEIERELTKTGNVLFGGKLGANPAYIDNFLKKKGYDVTMSYFPKTNEIEEEVKSGDTCILLFGYTDENRIPGAHYVTINYDENSDAPFKIFNANNIAPKELSVYNIDDYIQKDIPLATYTIRRKLK